MIFYIKIFLISILLSFQSFAIQDIYISKGVNKLMPVAINRFVSSAADQKLLDDVLNVIRSDLQHCGFFKIVPQDAFIDQIIGVENRPHFASWRQINTNLLLNGQIQRNGSSELVIKIILWDTVNEKSIFAQNFTSSTQLWRKLAHTISDKIYESVTGDPGYFGTRIFYISEIATGIRVSKRLAVIDYDGQNNQFLTNGKHLVLTPSISPNAQYLLYVSYERRVPKIFIRDLKTSRSSLLGNVNAMSFSPKFSPDGSKVIFSMAKNGVTDIFIMDLQTNTINKITSGISINTSPTYSPDSQTIYFNSDRSGSGQIYSMNADGSNIKRISFGEGNYSAPSCSPNGKYIVFTKKVRNQEFTLGVMKIDGSDERIITSGYLVEGATWSPNSRIISFARTTAPYRNTKSSTKLYTIDISGYNERLVPTLYDASDPEWSWHHYK